MSGASGKQSLYMDVRSLATGNLLATWTLGVLKPLQEPHGVTNPGASEVMGDENRIGRTGEYQTAFIQVTIDECNKSTNSAPPTYCSCYAHAVADSVYIKELKEGMTAVRPKMDAAAQRCRTN